MRARSVVHIDYFLIDDYLKMMTKVNAEMVVPADFPELKLLAWSRDPGRPIPPDEAFELYERNWRHVDVERLTPEEADLIDNLTQKFGGGHRMFA